MSLSPFQYYLLPALRGIMPECEARQGDSSQMLRLRGATKHSGIITATRRDLTIRHNAGVVLLRRTFQVRLHHHVLALWRMVKIAGGGSIERNSALDDPAMVFVACAT